MPDKDTAEQTAQRLELLDIYHRNRRELERREAGHDVLTTPLDLRSALVEVRERIDDLEARLQSAPADAALPAWRRRQAQAEVEHVQALQKTRRAKLGELERREAAHGPGQAPLELLHSLEAERRALEGLDGRLRRARAELAALEAPSPPDSPPAQNVQMHLLIVTPDGARYETRVAADTLVAQVQAAFLAQWQPPAAEALLRYALRLEADGRLLDPALTLAEAGLPDGAALLLVAEPLTPDSPVGLTVEDAAGQRYVTAVRLDTPVGTLAQAFVDAISGGGRAVVELASGPQGMRRLQPEATLYDERVGDGALLRISTAA